MKKMLTLITSISMLSILLASNYEAGGDFNIDNHLVFDNVTL